MRTSMVDDTELNTTFPVLFFQSVFSMKTVSLDAGKRTGNGHTRSLVVQMQCKQSVKKAHFLNILQV
jgi:hypothetical protein